MKGRPRKPREHCGTFPSRVRPALVRVVLVLVCWCVALVATRSLGYGAEETAALVSAIAALVSAARSTAGDPGVRAVPSA